MSIVEDMTAGQLESLDRLDRAIRAVVAIVLPQALHAGAGLLGSALQLLAEEGCTEAQAVEQVHFWFANHPDIRARLARLAMKLVPEPTSDGPEVIECLLDDAAAKELGASDEPYCDRCK